MDISTEDEANRKPCYLTPNCKIQLKEAIEFMADYSPKQAKKMYDKFFKILELLEIWPEVGSIYIDGMRKFLLGKFPYYIYYREKEDEIEIVGIHHTSRGTEFSEE